jgi:hypothetical protein
MEIDSNMYLNSQCCPGLVSLSCGKLTREALKDVYVSSKMKIKIKVRTSKEI